MSWAFLVSKANNWVITDPQIVMALQYGNPLYPPYSIGNEYVSVSEKNEVADSWVNRTAEAWVQERVRWPPVLSAAVVLSARFASVDSDDRGRGGLRHRVRGRSVCRGAKGGGKAVRESKPAGAVRTVALQLPGDSRTQRDGCS